MNDEDKVYHDLLNHVLHLLEHDVPVMMVAGLELIRTIS